jgi:hypothetical protein
MYAELINRSQDLTRLRNEGYALEIRDNFLLLHEIPYVDENRQIKFGILVSDLSSMAGDQTTSPIQQHVAYFIGDYPCDSNGAKIMGFHNPSAAQQISQNILVNHTFSAKPKDPDNYIDYYEKMINYVNIISPHAKLLDPDVTAQPFKEIDSIESNTPFRYIDTNTLKNKTGIVTKKIMDLNIGVIGLGGSGSYILDFLAKTPVASIHLFDGDRFLQHNAFRAPGAPSLEELRNVTSKVLFMTNIYSKMRKEIIPHDLYLNENNLELLNGLDFVFISIDKGVIKKTIINHLINQGIAFTDAGLSVDIEGDSLYGIVQLTTGTSHQNSHISNRIDFSDTAQNGVYDSNIQICELNALNATMAVIKWKKYFGFYHDISKEYFSVYSINDGTLINEDVKA